jgi:hypothetical protein
MKRHGSKILFSQLPAWIPTLYFHRSVYLGVPQRLGYRCRPQTCIRSWLLPGFLHCIPARPCVFHRRQGLWRIRAKARAKNARSFSSEFPDRPEVPEIFLTEPEIIISRTGTNVDQL